MKSELNPTDRANFENSSFKECKWVDIHVENEKTLIGVCNRAPLTSAQEDEGSIELILKASNEITLVMGDFNIPGIKWKSSEASGNEETFLEYIQGSFFTQYVLLPTRGNNILDLVMSNEEGVR